MDQLISDIQACRICAERFGATQTAHDPRPVPWLSNTAPVLIAGQAPGARVHGSGVPFDDPSGDRLRAWMGITRETFYDRDKVAILPMAFCFPGYKNKADLPPPPICAKTWRGAALAAMPQIKLTILVGSYAMRWHLGDKRPVRDIVADRTNLPGQTIALPHPSWRNTSWLKQNPWFEADILPPLRRQIAKLIP